MRVSLFVVHFIFGFLTLLPEAVRVSTERATYSERVKVNGTRSVFESNDIKVMAWTWNSLKRDLSLEAADVFSSDANVIVTCQTEAVRAVKEFVDDSRWLLVSHGEHTGFSGGHSDAQILSIFVRQPSAGQPFVATRPPESQWSRSGIGLGMARLTSDTCMDSAEVPGLLSVETTIHQTSSSGKGGLSAHISWDAREGHAAHKTSFLCAHLNSQSEVERGHQLVHIFQDMTGLTGVTRRTLERIPCIFWDYQSQECQQDVQAALNSRETSPHERARIAEWLSEMENVANPLRTDAMIILGDLNYRLSYSDLNRITPFELDETEPLARLVSTAEGRQEMAVADPLNSHGSHPTTLVRPFPQGFGFTCNDPYRVMPWTYKRRNSENCVSFGIALRRCDEGNATACEEAPGLARACYAKRNAHDSIVEQLTGSSGQPDSWEWQTKGPDLQVGWLDRFCIRAVGSSNLRVDFTGEERGWTETGDGDHLAVSSILHLTLP